MYKINKIKNNIAGIEDTYKFKSVEKCYHMNSIDFTNRDRYS